MSTVDVLGGQREVLGLVYRYFYPNTCLLLLGLVLRYFFVRSSLHVRGLTCLILAVHGLGKFQLFLPQLALRRIVGNFLL